MSITIWGWCPECNRDFKKVFKSKKHITLFNCPKCNTELRACSLCDLINITHCGIVDDGGCIFLDNNGSIRTKEKIQQILFDRNL